MGHFGLFRILVQPIKITIIKIFFIIIF